MSKEEDKNLKRSQIKKTSMTKMVIELNWLEIVTLVATYEVTKLILIVAYEIIKDRINQKRKKR